MRKARRRTGPAVALAVAVGVAASATTIYAATLPADGTQLRAAWINGG
jgi:hypothetical protein